MTTRPETCAFCSAPLPSDGHALKDWKPACVECWCRGREPSYCYDCGEELTDQEVYCGDVCDACAAKGKE